MISGNHELYRTVERICQSLDESGERQVAGSLRDAMSISSIPGEVLEEIGAALNDVRRTRAYESPDMRTDVEDAINYIDRVLD